ELGPTLQDLRPDWPGDERRTLLEIDPPGTGQRQPFASFKISGRPCTLADAGRLFRLVYAGGEQETGLAGHQFQPEFVFPGCTFPSLQDACAAGQRVISQESGTGDSGRYPA